MKALAATGMWLMAAKPRKQGPALRKARVAQPPGARLQLELLGGFRLKGPQGDIDLGAGKLCGLLAYLACTAPEPQPRDRLMTLFWGSHFEPQARQNLRQALSRLRRALGSGAISGNEEAVTLVQGAIACDATAFETSLQDGSPDALERSVVLYQDAFLSNITIREEAWSEWSAAQRTRLEGLALGAIIRLGEHELDRGHPERALELADRAITIDDMVEGAHRLSLRALAASGRRAVALRRYEQFSALLKRELDVTPDSATQALAAELRRAGTTNFVAGPRDETENSALTLPDRPSIAVLPFANMSGDPQQEYFADGMVEDIITLLSRSRSLFVIARNSSFTYKGRAVDVKQIARELRVRYVLEGGVRSGGNRVRITAQLIDAETGNHIWAQRYDRDATDVFAVQDEITEAVAIAIEPAVAELERRRTVRKLPESLGAWEAYQRGLWHLGRISTADNEAARSFFRRAIDIDPNFASAHAELAHAIQLEASLYQTRKITDALEEALALATRAISLDPLDATGHKSLGLALLGRGDPEGALAEARQALVISPNYATAYQLLGTTLTFSGQPRAGLEAFRSAVRLDPYDPVQYLRLTHTVHAHYFLREYDAAIEAAKEAFRSYPDHPWLSRCFPAALGQAGRLDEARQALKKTMILFPRSFDMYARERVAWIRPEDHEHILEGLRKAGWED
jgi:TolB-like protein/two-component SAPR family response regulator